MTPLSYIETDMRSKRRIESSRANGAKSRGPVMPAGRLKSSRNNLRHGLLAGIVVLPNQKPEAFTDLLAVLTREINPQTEAQRALVETMAAARWRLMRIWTIERAALQAEIEKARLRIPRPGLTPFPRIPRARRPITDARLNEPVRDAFRPLVCPVCRTNPSLTIGRT